MDIESIRKSANARAKSFLRELRVTLRLITKSPISVIGLCFILVIVFIAIFAGFVSPYDPYDMRMERTLWAPSFEHPFGTDQLGRDVLSRTFYGAAISLQTSLFVVAIAFSVGLITGLVSGYKGGLVDEVIMRVTDVFFAFPSIILAMFIAVSLGPGLISSALAIAVVMWPTYARLARGSVLQIKTREYVEGARAIGESDFSIIFRYILPNIISPIIVKVTLDIGSIILLISGLSFIGFGAQPPTPEWGAMVSSGRLYIMNQWWLSTFPGLMILLTVLGFNLFGDGLRDALDPRLRGER